MPSNNFSLTNENEQSKFTLSIMQRIEHKLAFRTQLYLGFFLAVAASLTLVLLCHFYLPLLIVGLSLLAVVATCVMTGLIVLGIDRRTSNSVREELKALNQTLEHLPATELQKNVSLYLEAAITLLFQSQVIPNKGDNLMNAGYVHLENLAEFCQQQEQGLLSMAELHELYKLLYSHSAPVDRDSDIVNFYKNQMNLYGALKQLIEHQRKADKYATALQQERKIPLRKFTCTQFFNYHQAQVERLYEIACDYFIEMGNAHSTIETNWMENKGSRLREGLREHPINLREASTHTVEPRVKNCFKRLGAKIASLQEGAHYFRYGFFDRLLHEGTNVKKGTKGAVELLTPRKYGKYTL